MLNVDCHVVRIAVKSGRRIAELLGYFSEITYIQADVGLMRITREMAWTSPGYFHLTK